MNKNHSDAEILAVFRDIDTGKIHNASFSEANVVIVSRAHYAAMQDMIINLRAHNTSDN